MIGTSLEVPTGFQTTMVVQLYNQICYRQGLDSATMPNDTHFQQAAAVLHAYQPQLTLPPKALSIPSGTAIKAASRRVCKLGAACTVQPLSSSAKGHSQGSAAARPACLSISITRCSSSRLDVSPDSFCQAGLLAVSSWISC